MAHYKLKLPERHIGWMKNYITRPFCHCLFGIIRSYFALFTINSPSFRCNYLKCFSLKCCDFSELCKFCCSACLWHTPRRNRERLEYGIYLKILEKTQYLMNTLYIIIIIFIVIKCDILSVISRSYTLNLYFIIKTWW